MERVNVQDVSAELRRYIQENINAEAYKFRIDFEAYYKDLSKPPQIDWSNTFKSQVDTANGDFERFGQIAKKRAEFQAPMQGDFVRMPDGELLRISVWSDSMDTFQAYYNGSIHVSKGGLSSFSGTCGNSYEKKNLRATNETQDGNCWIFSEYRSGGGRGVHWNIPFKVWEYKTA